MDDNIVKLSFQDRIERLAISYAQSHYDVKLMSLAEYLKTVNQIENEIAELLRQ